MTKPPLEETSRLERRAVVTYHVAPTSFLGRIFAFVLAAVVLVAALFISFMVFWAVLTIVLFAIIYAMWASRHGPRNTARVLDADRERD